MPDPQRDSRRMPPRVAVAAAATELRMLVDAELPQRFYPSEPKWRAYGAAMIARMADLVESCLVLMEADRAMDGGVLVRVLYEHVVQFCWIAIDPEKHLVLWSEAALASERKLHHDLVDYDEGFLTDDEVAAYARYEDLKPVLQLAERADRHWRGRITGFEFDRPGPSRKYTLRHLYSPVYRTLSEGVHGAPQALRANMELGSPKRVSVGELEVVNVFWWPLTVMLYSKALLVSAHVLGWPDLQRVCDVNNGMYPPSPNACGG